jgi:hypothetical protein
MATTYGWESPAEDRGARMTRLQVFQQAQNARADDEWRSGSQAGHGAPPDLAAIHAPRVIGVAKDRRAPSRCARVRPHPAGSGTKLVDQYRAGVGFIRVSSFSCVCTAMSSDKPNPQFAPFVPAMNRVSMRRNNTQEGIVQSRDGYCGDCSSTARRPAS